MDKIIFLDFDGVIASQNHSNFLYQKWLERTNPVYLSDFNAEKMNDGFYKDKYDVLFDPKCVLWLDYLIEQTNAKIVVTSDWGREGLDWIKQLWADRKMKGEIINVTTKRDDYDRSSEIRDYIIKHDVKKYVVIDDEPLNVNFFVQSDSNIGLTYLNSKFALNYLL